MHYVLLRSGGGCSHFPCRQNISLGGGGGAQRVDVLCKHRLLSTPEPEHDLVWKRRRKGGGQKVPNGKFIFHPAESPGEKFKNYKFRMLSPADMIFNGSWRNVRKMWSPNFILHLNLCIYYRSSSHIHICMKPHRV